MGGFRFDSELLGYFFEVWPWGAQETQHEAEERAGDESDEGVGEKAAGDAVAGVGVAVDDLHVNDGDEGGGVEEAVLRGGQRIVPADGFEGDGGDAGVGESLEDVFADHGDGEGGGGVVQEKQAGGEERTGCSDGEIERAEGKELGKRNEDEAAEDSGEREAGTADEGDHARGGLEVVAETAESVGERERGTGGSEECERDEDLSAANDGEDLSKEFRKAFAGEAAVRAGRGHDEEDRGGDEDDQAKEDGGELEGKSSDKFTGKDGHEAVAAEGRRPGPGAELALVMMMDDGGEPAAERVGAQLGRGETGEHEDFEESEVRAVEQGDAEADSSKGCEEGRVEAAAEADVEHGAKKEDTNATREDCGGDSGDSRFGNMLGGEQLGKGERDEARVEAER